MSQENQSCLRFSLEETLWFRKGQEVDELVSISLDPDITIQENDQYVTIRGSLELTGEYNNSNENKVTEEEIQTTHKYVQAVEEREGGSCEFSHHFPVDITIPNNRIQSIYDIDVSVESFDYTIPERSCLKLSAELTISGLYGAQQNESAEDSTILETLQRNEEEEQIFAVEARKQQEEATPVPEPMELPTFSYQEVRNNDHQEMDFVEQPIVVEQEVIIVEESSSSSSSKEESPPKPEVKKKKDSKKKSMSLKEFFARKEEPDEHAKIKICIVQKGDTIDLLADRYDVSVQNILRVNHLEISQDVHEGQVLYIPFTLQKR